MRATITLDVVTFEQVQQAVAALKRRGYVVLDYDGSKPPYPVVTCYHCDKPFTDSEEIVRHDILDDKGFGRLNAPFHVGCDVAWLEERWGES